MTALPRDLEQRAREVVGQVLEEDPAAIDDGTSPDTLPAWDSLRHFQLVMALEEAFGISFTMDEVVAMRSFGAIKDLIGRNGV